GYRIGITTGARDTRHHKSVGADFKVGLMVRSIQEMADKMWILKVCDSRSEATFYEALYSARYGLPTMVFHLRGRKMNVAQEQVDRLFAEIDTRSRVQQLFEDFCLFEAYPHLTPKSRFESERFYVNLTMFGDSRISSKAPWGGHRIQFGTTELSLRPAFEEAGFPCRPGKRHTWRHESARINFGEAANVVEQMQNLDSRIAVRKSALLVEGLRSFAETPAGHFHPGMSIAVEDQGRIVEDIVASVTSEDYQGLVYDLDIANVHNFICEQIVCHNSIYAFRGSDFKIILGFQKDYPNAKVVKLEENYRSTKRILEAANHVIAKNTERFDKKLFSNAEEGAKIRYAQVYDGEAEARFIVNKIEEHLRREPNIRAAVLYRTNAQSRSFEEACRRAGLRYNLVGGFSFYERAEVKDVIAYLKLAMNPHDSISLMRVINVPTRGIGKSTLDELEKRVRDLGVSHWEAIAYIIEHQTLPARATTALQSFRDIVTRLVEKTQTAQLSEIVKAAIIDTGYERALKSENTEEAEARLLNLEELVNAAAESEEQGEGLRDFLDHAALVSDADQYQAEAQVTLMTMHAAKGLEFPLVFIAGLEENLFPHSRVRDNMAELEEERRLCYVAITRAEKYLYITHAMKRRVYGEEMPAEPSRFLMEFPLDLIEDISTGPSWLRFATKTSTRENYEALDALTSDESYQPKRTGQFQGKTYNSVDSVKEFFARQGKKIDGGSFGSSGSSSSSSQNRPPANRSNYSSGSSSSSNRSYGSGSSSSKSSGSSSSGGSGLRANMRVKHAKYGIGLIIRVEGEGDDAKLTINFPGYGTKKMIAKYAGLEKA
ncbi:MAG TPA: 3'-5' exonuclease, partial [Blastocatellia bacterium]|nr:3'-5' exonuclease [Blastocatellia bacterium]